jgi:hypothetical protein
MGFLASLIVGLIAAPSKTSMPGKQGGASSPRWVSASWARSHEPARTCRALVQGARRGPGIIASGRALVVLAIWGPSHRRGLQH